TIVVNEESSIENIYQFIANEEIIIDGFESSQIALETAEEAMNAKTREINKVEADKKEAEGALEDIKSQLENMERTIKNKDIEKIQAEIRDKEADRDSKQVQKDKLNEYIKNPSENHKAILDLGGADYQEDVVFISVHINSTDAQTQTGASG